MFVDHYQVLQVKPDASHQAIVRAYRVRAQKTHPDRNPGSEALFIEVRQAFEVLSDPARRSRFDQQRRDHLTSRASSSGLVATPPSFSGWWSDIRDRWRQPSTLPQADKATTFIRVPLAKIITGTTHRINLKVARACPSCQGQKPSCRTCGGTGQRFILRSWNIDVPAGTPDGAILRLPGQGHQGPRFGSAGDVLVHVVWTRRHNWRWEGGQLVSTQRVRRDLLKKGGRMRIRAPDGRWGYIDVPPGAVAARRIQVPGLGLPMHKGARTAAWVECLPR